MSGMKDYLDGDLSLYTMAELYTMVRWWESGQIIPFSITEITMEIERRLTDES